MKYFLNIPDSHITLNEEDIIEYDFNLTVFFTQNQIKLSAGDFKTSWLDLKDSFLKRIEFENLNHYFLQNHIQKEIEIKNILDDASDLLDREKHAGAISLLDEVLYYDSEYGEALMLKSKAFFAQGHYVKSLRHYKKAIKEDLSLKDVDYHKMLLKRSSKERDNFPKIKRNIYAGDEYFAKADFTNALASYEKALVNPTSFKAKILYKLLNKKATALVKLNRIAEAVEVFKESVSVKENDYAYFNLGLYDDVSYMKNAVKISKKQLLLKARRLHEAYQNDIALVCIDDFFKNHYKIDDDYRFALNLKLEVLKELSMDVSEIESLIRLL